MTRLYQQSLNLNSCKVFAKFSNTKLQEAKYLVLFGLQKQLGKKGYFELFSKGFETNMGDIISITRFGRKLKKVLN